MKKTIAVILALFALCTVFCSCSKEEKNTASDTQQKAEEAKPVDPETAAKAIVEQGDFEGKLDKMNDAAIDVYYPSLPSDTKFSVYISESYSDEVAVFVSADLDAVESIVKAHIEEQTAVYKDYAPEQSHKAESNSVIVKKNGALVLIISNASVSDAKALAEKVLG